MIAWSCGGGRQFAAMAVLIHQGIIPKPDLACIANTGREKRTTWRYLGAVMRPYLKEVGVKVVVIPRSFNRVGYYGKSGLPLSGVYTATGKVPKYCSGEWKRDTVERWLRAQGVEECDCYIGYSSDEQRRVMQDHRDWCHYRYPLIELGINLASCLAIVERAGLPQAPKSRCYDCPEQNDDEWEEVRADPADWQRAVATEKEVNELDPRGDGLYLWSGRVPLEMADFTRGQGQLFPARHCQGGDCFT